MTEEIIKNLLLNSKNFDNNEKIILENFYNKLLNSMYPVVYTDNDAGKVDFLRTSFGVELPTIGRQINVILTKINYQLIEKELSLNNLEETLNDLINQIDDEFVNNCLKKQNNSLKFKDFHHNNLIYAINNTMNNIARCTRIGPGNKVLISQSIFDKIKNEIVIKNSIDEQRNINYIGDLNLAKVYLYNTNDDNFPIYVWYSGEKSEDNPFVYVTKSLNKSEKLINSSSFVEDNSSSSLSSTKDYIGVIEF